MINTIKIIRRNIIIIIHVINIIIRIHVIHIIIIMIIVITV